MSKGSWFLVGLLFGGIIVAAGGWVALTLLNLPMM